MEEIDLPTGLEPVADRLNEADYIEAREKQSREFRLLFPTDFPGDSESMFNQLVEGATPVPETDGGVKITRRVETGHGPTLSTILKVEQQTMKQMEDSEKYQEIRKNTSKKR